MDNNNITFSEAMYDPKQPDRKVVAQDTFDRFDYWKSMGLDVRTICEGQLLASLESIVELKSPAEWRKFWKYAQKKAKHYEDKLILLAEEQEAKDNSKK